MKNKQAFTLLEIMIVIIILGFLATIGLQKYAGVLESFTAKDGQAMLRDMYGAQKRYFLDTDTYAAQLGDLDITFKGDNTFDTPVACDLLVDGKRIIAYVDRNSTAYQYRLRINTEGEITCVPTEPATICQKLGF